MNKLEKLLGLVTLGGSLLLPSCATYSHLQPEEIGVKDIGNHMVYVGEGFDKVTDYKSAVNRIKKDKESGALFVGFSPEEVKTGREVITSYNRINPRLIGRLEPIIIKAEIYSPTEAERQELHELCEKYKNSISDMINDGKIERFNELYDKIEGNVVGLAESNKKGDVLQYLSTLNKYIHMLGKSEDNKNMLLRSTTIPTALTIEEDINILMQSDLRKELLDFMNKGINSRSIDGFDIVYWVGNYSQNRVNNKETLAHELGHLIIDEDQKHFLPIIDLFKRLRDSSLTDYSRTKTSSLEGIFQFSPLDDVLRNIKTMPERISSEIALTTSIIEDLNVKLKISRSSGLDTKEIERKIKQEERRLFDYQQFTLKVTRIPDDKQVKATIQRYNRDFNQKRDFIVLQEELAEASMFMALGKEVEDQIKDDAGREKIKALQTKASLLK